MSIPSNGQTATSSSLKTKPKSPKSSPSTTHVNPTSVPEMSAAALPNGGLRQRGPVEEVIAKRMRQLGKKLQRYRTYVVQPIDSLNADQREALVTLPALEGAYKELEDLIREKGPVDEQELIQAAKMREASEAAERKVEPAALARVKSFQNALVHPLSRFLRLYTLLHPAQSNDHAHLTFSHLDLPSSLRDEVQATDILRVGRMYEDILAGEDAAKIVLSILVEGPKGEDEEDDRVHHLIQLLDQPEAEAEAEAGAGLKADDQDEDGMEAEPEKSDFHNIEEPSEVTQTDIVPIKEVVSPVSRTPSDLAMANGHKDERPTLANMALNFLQDDELAEPNIEDSYEVVPMLEPHQTSGLQPPSQDPEVSAVESAKASPFQSHDQIPDTIVPPNGHREWAELDDDDDGPAFASSAITMAVPKLEEEISIATAEEATTTLVQEDEMAVETPGLDPVFEPPTGVENPEHSQGTSTTTSAPIRTGQSAAVPSRLRAASGRGQQTPKQREPTTVLDADGFEMKVKRPSTQAFRGRGGRGGGDGERGRGGYSRGRDGRGGGSAPQAQYKSMRKDGQPGEAMGTGQSIPLTRSKNIFKDVQPSGPKSAPVI